MSSIPRVLCHASKRVASRADTIVSKVRVSSKVIPLEERPGDDHKKSVCAQFGRYYHMLVCVAVKTQRDGMEAVNPAALRGCQEAAAPVERGLDVRKVRLDEEDLVSLDGLRVKP